MTTKKRTTKDENHYDGRVQITADTITHIQNCTDCKKLYGQTLSGWEHPAPKRDR